MVSNGRHSVSECLSLFGSQRIEDQPLDVFDVKGRQIVEALAAFLRERCVLSPAIVGVVDDFDLTALNEDSKPVGESALR